MSAKKNLASNIGLLMSRLLFQKLKKGLSVLVLHSESYDEYEGASMVPDDVKEGHFTVLAIKGEETKRFILELRYLSNPAFLRLLDQAEEEYGFKRKGILAIPCRPAELQTILEE